VSSSAADLDLYGACRILFGAGVRLDQDFLGQLDADMVRRRFRKRAVEVHPDRAAVLRRHPAVLAEAFKEVEAAYRTLRAHLAAGERAQARADGPGPCRPTSPARPVRPSSSSPSQASSSPRSSAGMTDHRWSGPIPSRTLRIGEFLYYSGHISWLELIRALVWQAQQRPCFGQVAHRFGYLTPERITSVLAHRRIEEKIGEAAMRLRFITSLQQQVVLHAQQRSCRRIGDYFVESGLLAAADLERIGHSVRAHNARVAFAHGAA
jgi:hypothetical protein